jgi:hypothetical protein
LIVVPFPFGSLIVVGTAPLQSITELHESPDGKFVDVELNNAELQEYPRVEIKPKGD